MKLKRIEDRMPINNHIPDLIHESGILLLENRKLKKEIENMKCCGNCCGFPTTDLDPCEHYKFGGNGSSGGYCCYRWTSDDKTRDERK